jgi:hypothetical protein
LDFLLPGNYLLLHVQREYGSVVCSAITHWFESRRTHNHILLSHLKLPKPGRPGPRIYILQERGISVIPLATGFPFRSRLSRHRLAPPFRHSAVTSHWYPF